MLLAEKYWNTWDPNEFSWMEHIEAGLCVVPGAYSAAENSYSHFAFDDQTRLLEHERKGRYCRLRVVHARAEFELEYAAPDPWTLLVRLTNVKPPREWGLRYHMLVSLGYKSEQGSISVSEDGRLTGCLDDYCAAAAFLESPYDIVPASGPDEVGEQMAGKGFKDTEKRSNGAGQWGTCRFVLEQSPQACLAVAIAHDGQTAQARADAACEYFSRWESLRDEILAERPKSWDESYPGMIEAVSDIMAWNDMYSRELNRVYTSISKHWNGEFGGWYLFFSDACYQIVLKAVSGDLEMASRNLDYALSAAMADGNFGGMLCGYQKWVDRTQPPVLAFAVWTYYLYSHDLSALQRAYPVLRRAQEWYMERRCTHRNGLIQLGTSKTGKGDYRGTKVAAKNEAAMDNSPMYDEAVFDAGTGTLQMYDIGITSQLMLDIQCTAEIAEQLGKPDEAAALREKAEKMGAAINEKLWDDQAHIYANRGFGGTFGVTSPTSFYPLAAGAVDEMRLGDMIRNVFDPEMFFTECPLIAINAKSPAAHENRYWRGRTWAPQSFWTYLGLRRYGKDQEANRLAAAALRYFDKYWRERRHAYENYNPFTGEGDDSVDSQSFYSWTALLPLMWTMEQFGADPWNGLCFGFSDGRPFRQENRLYEGARYTACSDGEKTELYRNGALLFCSDLKTRFKHFEWKAHYGSVEMEAKETGTVRFCKAHPRMVLADGAPLPECTSEIAVSPGHHRIEIFW